MALTVTVDRRHLIAMGLYSKYLNNQPVSFSEDELANFIKAYEKIINGERDLYF